MMRKLLFGFLIVALSVLVFTSCSDDDSDDTATPTCDSCTAASPWSKPAISTCYATKAACESAEGGTCQVCN